MRGLQDGVGGGRPHVVAAGAGARRRDRCQAVGLTEQDRCRQRVRGLAADGAECDHPPRGRKGYCAASRTGPPTCRCSPKPTCADLFLVRTPLELEVVRWCSAATKSAPPDAGKAVDDLAAIGPERPSQRLRRGRSAASTARWSPAVGSTTLEPRLRRAERGDPPVDGAIPARVGSRADRGRALRGARRDRGGRRRARHRPHARPPRRRVRGAGREAGLAMPLADA